MGRIWFCVLPIEMRNLGSFRKFRRGWFASKLYKMVHVHLEEAVVRSHARIRMTKSNIVMNHIFNCRSEPLHGSLHSLP